MILPSSLINWACLPAWANLTASYNNYANSLQCCDTVGWVTWRAGIRPVKCSVLVCWYWYPDWSFARLIAPVVTTISFVLASSRMETYWYQITQVHVENMAVIMDRNTMNMIRLLCYFNCISFAIRLSGCKVAIKLIDWLIDWLTGVLLMSYCRLVVCSAGVDGRPGDNAGSVVDVSGIAQSC